MNIVIHVDDFAVFHNDKQLCDKIYNKMNDTFKMKRGNLEYFLGMRVRKHKDGSYTLDQEQYTRSILNRFGMSNCKDTHKIPESNRQLTIEDCPKTDEEKKEMKKYPYPELIGSLNYLVTGTRPDLAHAVSMLARFMHNPGRTHWRAGMKVLHYLNGTVEYGLCFVCSSRNDGL